MRYRAMGILFIMSGVFFLAGVLDPPILPTWGGSPAQVKATAAAHRAAWFASTWLITLSIVAGLAAVELLARTLGTDLARVGRSLYLAGSALGLASTAFDQAVTSTLLGAPRLPGWYFGIQHWADGLGTAYFALLAPAAMGCIAVAILRTRVLPRWTGYVFLAATSARMRPAADEHQGCGPVNAQRMGERAPLRDSPVVAGLSFLRPRRVRGAG